MLQQVGRTFLGIMMMGACSGSPDAAGTVAPTVRGSGSDSGSAATPAATNLTAALVVNAAVLADDCGASATTADAKPAVPDSKRAAPDDADQDSWVAAPCAQSSVQLGLTALGAGPAAPVAITEITVLDEAGARLGAMTPGAPLVWRRDAYDPWDALLRPGDALRLSVPSSAPPWASMSGGRWGSGMYQIQVTVTIGGTRVTARSTVSVVAEPMVDT